RDRTHPSARPSHSRLAAPRAIYAVPARGALGDRRGVAELGELALEHLAGRVARELFQEGDLAWHLEAGEVRLHVSLHLLLAQALAVAHNDERLQALAEVRIGDPDDRDLIDLRMLGEQVLDLAREHV